MRRTPHIAIGLIFVLIVILILSGDISQLASATVLLLLLVFSVVNSALVILKLRPGEPEGAFELPLAVPALGAVVLCCAVPGAGRGRRLARTGHCRRTAAGSRRALSLDQTEARRRRGVASGGLCPGGGGRYEDPPPIETARAEALRGVPPAAGFTKIRRR